LQQCINETLRLEPPAPASQSQNFIEDTWVNYGGNDQKVLVKAHTQIMIQFDAIHHDANEWPEPFKWIPDRFDNQSKWSLNKAGKPRNPLSFTPFMGGKRICLGKTFADVNMKLTVPLLLHSFSFELQQSDYEKPLYSVGGSKEIDVPVTLHVINQL
jgi:cytochrome P450